ncbi:MAG: hypothetical protein KC643_33625, partial [Nitrospira sp.]|nr:hypothetical protein [Nitrospira sp.]
MTDYPTRPQPHISIGSIGGLLLLALTDSLTLTTPSQAEQPSQALLLQPCTNQAPVTNECVEA